MTIPPATQPARRRDSSPVDPSRSSNAPLPIDSDPTGYRPTRDGLRRPRFAQPVLASVRSRGISIKWNLIVSVTDRTLPHRQILHPPVLPGLGAIRRQRPNQHHTDIPDSFVMCALLALLIFSHYHNPQPALPPTSAVLVRAASGVGASDAVRFLCP